MWYIFTTMLAVILYFFGTIGVAKLSDIYSMWFLLLLIPLWGMVAFIVYKQEQRLARKQ